MEVIEKKGKAWSAWTYSHPEKKERLLREQLSKDKYFHIYVHDTKKPGENVRKRHGATHGSGFVEYKLYVTKMNYKHYLLDSPDLELSIPYTRHESSCGWYLVEDINDIPPRHWSNLIDFQTRKNIDKFIMNRPNANWLYIIDPCPR